MSKNSPLDITTTLEELNPLINYLAKQNVPWNILSSKTLDLEIDDLAQIARIKLWQALQKEHIDRPRAYVKRIVFTETVNRVRRHKKAPTCSIEDVGKEELCQEDALIAASEGMCDPCDEITRRESWADGIRKIVNCIQKLPGRQRYAMICALKEKSEDTFPILDALREQKVDIEVIHWPRQKDALQRLRASLYIARKKLRRAIGEAVFTW